MNTSLSFSVIVPVLNAEKDIGECIESLLALDYPEVDIVVIDNGSTDNTAILASEYPVRVVTEPRKGAYIARNTGLQYARGDIIAFMDADCVADKDWLRALARHYDDPGVAGAGGRLVAYPPKNIVEEFLSFGDLRIVHSKKKKVLYRDKNRFLSGALGSANMSYRRSVLEAMKGFDETFSYFGGAYDLCWRIQSRGQKVIYDPNAVVVHKMRQNLSQLVKQFYGLGKGLPLLMKLQPGRYSYITIKSYLLPKYEFKISSPFRFIITLDVFLLSFLGLFLILVHPLFFYVIAASFCGILSTVLIKSARIVRKSKKVRWLFIFPFFHFIRICSETFGKIIGGIKTGVIAF